MQCTDSCWKSSRVLTNAATVAAAGILDHVLREEERKQGAFASVCFYILANPVRAKLAVRETDWAFSGAVVPGYPDLHPCENGFWELFWKLYHQNREPANE